MKTFADIILPLPLHGSFTYSVPPAFEHTVERGQRALVPFGKNKTYIGLIDKVHNNKPHFVVKDISMIIDVAPIVTDCQLTLWHWIADYYMSPIGEVLNAALPGGLKTLDTYKPKTETCVELAQEYRSEQNLHIALDMLRRSDKQKKVLSDFLALSHWDTINGNTCNLPIQEVTKDELLNASHCTTAVLKALIDKHIISTYEREVGRLNNGGQPHLDHIKILSTPQQVAYNNIISNFLKKNVVLLHGVTSSGKTEIFIHLIQLSLQRGQQVLYLLPEIALTVQIRQRLQDIFGDNLGIYHSKYSDAERVEIWKKQMSQNPYSIILGARSATLLPFQNLGLVIVDEEHETSFKQQDPAPRYHARSTAIMLARMYGAKTLLASATPSSESFYNSQIGKYGYVRLSQRFGDSKLPEIRIIDLNDLQRRKMMNASFSPQLLNAIRNALNSRQQAILFQNRRGFAPMIECHDCGWVPHCNSCDVSLTYHKRLGQLSCHYCGATYSVPDACPCCGCHDLRGRGYGTESIEDKVLELFPDARVARMDLDTTRTRNAYERIINDFSAHRTDILIGTQMVSKGLDFDNVSVVGILNADNMLNYPDFRAYEQAFMMMAQVSGRAGRKGQQGLVILQTKNPQLPVIAQVVRNDCEGFYADLLSERQRFHYPPFYHIINIYLRHRDNSSVEIAGKSMGAILRSWFGNRVLGPDKPAVARVKTLHIRKILLKLENGIDFAKVRQYLYMAQEMILNSKKYGALTIIFDVDPL